VTDVRTGLEIVTLETPSLGDRSYLAVADGWAIAIDPQRDVDRVERVLADSGLRLGAVLETHLHNDYVTGGRALALRQRATYALPAGPPISFDARRVGDGDGLAVGPMRVTVTSSPGHAEAHAAYEVRVDGAPSGAAFTGGSLLLGATGRTDLHGADRAEALARQQYRSVRRLAMRLPADTMVCPTHGFGSYCAAGRPTGGGPVLADQLRTNDAFHLDEDTFVARTLRGLRPYPRYFAFMAQRNAWFPTPANLEPLPEIEPEVLPDDGPAIASRVILDVRPRADYAAGHVAGSLHVDGRGAVATWFGWLASIEAEVYLVASSRSAAAAAQRDLRRIGVDHIAAACIAPDLSATGGTRSTRVALLRRATFADLSAELRLGEDIVVLDVREAEEREAVRIPGSLGIAVHDLPGADLERLRGRNVWVHCAAGFRATIAASLLERAGIPCVIVDDLIDVAAELGLAVEPRRERRAATDADADAATAERVAIPGPRRIAA